MIFISNVGFGGPSTTLTECQMTGGHEHRKIGASEVPEGQGMWKKVETGCDERQYIYHWDKEGTYYGSEYSQAVSARPSSTGGFGTGKIAEKWKKAKWLKVECLE